jgi:hypothetical protein
MTVSPHTTIYYPPELRARWPRVAQTWVQQYPQLFDRDDLRLVLSQPRYHVPEWFTAIHLFHRDGVRSLVEKYSYRNHGRKRDVLHRVLTGRQLEFLDGMVQTLKVQPPDLFVFGRSGNFRFAEAKGPGDRISHRQRESHRLIRQELGVPVEIFAVREGIAGRV